MTLGVVLIAALAGQADAQVTVNLNALSSLPAEPASSVSHHHPEHRMARARDHRLARKHRHESTVATVKPSSTAAPAPPPKSVAVAAVPMPTITQAPPPPPPTGVAVLPSAAPPKPPEAAAPPAPTPAPHPATVRVGFAAGQTTLTPEASDAVAELAHAAPHGDSTSFEVAAYAPAEDGDASTARRLSLARALAVRAALVSAGVPAASIYVRALGVPPAGQTGDADRAVVTVMGANSAPSPPAQQASDK